MESVHFNRPVSCMMLLKVSSSRLAICHSASAFGYTVLTWHAAQSRQGRTCVHRGEGRMRPLAILYPRLLYGSQSRKHFCEQAGGRRERASERALFIMKRRQVGLFGAKIYLSAVRAAAQWTLHYSQDTRRRDDNVCKCGAT